MLRRHMKWTLSTLITNASIRDRPISISVIGIGDIGNPNIGIGIGIGNPADILYR